MFRCCGCRLNMGGAYISGVWLLNDHEAAVSLRSRPQTFISVSCPTDFVWLQCESRDRKPRNRPTNGPGGKRKVCSQQRHPRGRPGCRWSPPCSPRVAAHATCRDVAALSVLRPSSRIYFVPPQYLSCGLPLCLRLHLRVRLLKAATHKATAAK